MSAKPRSRRPEPMGVLHALTLRQAAEALPGVVTPSMVRSWQKVGCDGARLETVWIDGRCHTTIAGLRVFLDRLNRKQQGGCNDS